MPMILGSYQICFRLYQCHSLKEKRFVLNSLRDRIFHRFKVSIAEVDDQDLWQRGTLGIAMVTSNKQTIERTFSKITRFVEADGRVEILETEKEIF